MRLIMSNQSFAFLLLSFFTISTVQAGSDYLCTIQRISFAETKLNPEIKLWEKTYIGEQFSVERKTGIMAGVLKNAQVSTPQIIDFGSKDNSFKVVTTMRIEEGAGAGSTISALTIEEFIESPKKPFVYLDTDVVLMVFFGTCEHF